MRADRPVLGVDVGGVVVDRVAEREDTSFFGNRPLETPAVPGVLDALAEVARELFAGRVHLLSKAGPRVEANTRSAVRYRYLFTGASATTSHPGRCRHGPSAWRPGRSSSSRYVRR
jgi:DNA helicase HerA-like ATPase